MLVSLTSLVAITVQAQQWPNKPVKMIAVFPPGGSVDTVSCILSFQLGKQLGQQFVETEIARWAKVVKDNKIKAGE